MYKELPIEWEIEGTETNPNVDEYNSIKVNSEETKAPTGGGDQR